MVLTGVLLGLLLPPQATWNARPRKRNSPSSKARDFLRAGRREHSPTPNNARPGIGSHSTKNGRERRPIAGAANATVGAVVLMVSTEVTEPLAVSVGAAGLKEQVGAAVGDGDTPHVRVTALLNPFCEFTVMFVVAELPAVIEEGEGALAWREKVGRGGVTDKAVVTECPNNPEVPVILME